VIHAEWRRSYSICVWLDPFGTGQVHREERRRGTYAQHELRSLRQGPARTNTCVSRLPGSRLFGAVIRPGRCFSGAGAPSASRDRSRARPAWNGRAGRRLCLRERRTRTQRVGRAAGPAWRGAERVRPRLNASSMSVRRSSPESCRMAARRSLIVIPRRATPRPPSPRSVFEAAALATWGRQSPRVAVLVTIPRRVCVLLRCRCLRQ
jgi:hypothetical protein